MPHHAVLRRARTEGLNLQLGADLPSDQSVHPPNSSERSEQPESQDVEWRVSGCELFFDLVYVVIIHVITLPLEEEELVLPWVWLQVILMTLTVWALWCTVSDYSVTARYYKNMKFMDSAIVLISMICSGFMARASQHGNMRVFVFWYLVSEVFVVLGYVDMTWRRTSSILRQDDMSQMRLATYFLICIFCLDAVLLVPASFLVEIHDNHFDAGLGVLIAYVGLKIFLLYVASAQLQSSFRSLDNFLRAMRPLLMLWQERFQLIILISLGEIVASAASAQGSAGGILELNILALGAMLMAIACYLLYFDVHPPGWKHPGELSMNKYTIEALATAVMTCGLAAIGASYSRFLEVDGKPEESNEEHPHQTVTLFCLATCLFLSASSVISLFGEGHAPASQQTRLSGKARGVVRITTSIVIGLIPLLALPFDLGLVGSESLALVIPCAMLILATFEALASTTRRMPAMS